MSQTFKPEDFACPRCGEALAMPTDGETVTLACASCGWIRDPEGEAMLEQAVEDVDEMKGRLLEGLWLGTTRILVPVVIAVPGVWLWLVPSYRQAGTVVLAFTYLFGYVYGPLFE